MMLSYNNVFLQLYKIKCSVGNADFLISSKIVLCNLKCRVLCEGWVNKGGERGSCESEGRKLMQMKLDLNGYCLIPLGPVGLITLNLHNT